MPRALILALALIAVSCATAPTPVPVGWSRVAGGEGTRCSLGSEFAFHVRGADPRRVMLYLQGGGACWNERLCDVQGQPAFDPSVEAGDDPSRMRHGLLDLANAENPVRDFSMVFVPYCTGDVHLGRKRVAYSDRVAIEHRGAANAGAAVDWLVRHFPDAELVFVTGSSAGAIPSPLVAAEVAKRLPRARVVQLGDAAGAYRSPNVRNVLATWGAPGPTFESFYTDAVSLAPRVMYAQYNDVDDATQRQFLLFLGVENPDVAALLRANLEEIRANNPRFRAYNAPGRDHTILLSRELYTLTVDGVRVRDWVADLIAGRAVRDVQ